jgi:dolichol kinase
MELPLLAGALVLSTTNIQQTALSCALMTLCWGTLSLPAPVLIAIQVLGHAITQVIVGNSSFWVALRAVEVSFHLYYRLPKAISKGAAVAIALLLSILPILQQKEPEIVLILELITALVDALLLASLVQFASYSGIRLGIVILPVFTTIAASSHISSIETILFAHQNMLFYWILLLGAALPCIFLLRKRLRKTITRKMFHFLVLCIFLPAIEEPIFLSLAFIAALNLFILVEFLRKLTPFAHINLYFECFMDSRDMGEVALTHIFLLFGCGFPVLMEAITGLSGLSHIGLLVLCIGDSLASIVGSTVGIHWLPYRKPKTWEGLLAGLGGMLAYSRLFYTYSGLFPAYSALWNVSFLAAFYEAFTLEIDNFSLPLFSISAYFFLHSN